ncbi:MAG: phosphomannomutase [Candidatus Tyloplasma litorale]|nr:MAG: phosphomannomutase [Mycoplasmatales bacterium]
MNWKDNYKYWFENAPKNIVEIIENYSEEDKKLYFSSDLKFGTAGIRSKMFYGTNVLNEFIVAKYALAFGQTIIAKYGKQSFKNGIVIAHDNRRNNILFSQTAAEVISALGIPVFLFKDNSLQPTPLLSFTIAKGNYLGGINITASHNPSEYNGMKVYNHTGTQMLPSDTNFIIKKSEKIKDIFSIKKSTRNIYELSESIESQYVQMILNMIPFKKFDSQKKIKVVFTSQHGTAGKLASKILDKMNVEHYFVQEQLNPDSEFPNTESPNPQDPRSFILAREYGDKYDADVLFCTDPDADRFGIEVKHNGKWVHIDGNELPLIQIEYKLRHLKKLGYINLGDFVVKSVVTSRSSEALINSYGIKIYENLIGFKWLISEAFKHEMKGNECLFVWEESYGSTVRSFTRDKDSFQALAQVIEIVDEYKSKGQTLVDGLENIYKKFGYWYSPQKQIKFDEFNGVEKLNKILEEFRKIKKGWSVDELVLTNIIDFSKGYKKFDKENFIMFEFNDIHRVTLRPSGTEPVLRIYFDVFGKSNAETHDIQNKLQTFFLKNV